MKTICLITNFYPTKTNPMQGIFFKEQIESLQNNYNFVVIHYDVKISGFLNNYRLIENSKTEHIIEKTLCINISKFYNLSFFIKAFFTHDYNVLCRVIKNGFIKCVKDDIDLLYCVSAQTEARYLNEISKVTGIPYIVSEHCPFLMPGNLLTQQDKEAIEGAKGILLISNDKYRQIAMQNVRMPKMFYVGNLVDENLFVYKKHNNHVKTFVIVAAFNYIKNYDYLNEIFTKLIQKTNEAFKLMIVGFDANKEYSKNIELFYNMINNSNYKKNVELIPFVERKNMPEIYNKADAFIMTSIQEGMPVSALEAGCCGLPIFSTRCGGVDDFVDEHIGRLYGLREADKFAEGLKEFLEQKIYFNNEEIRKTIISKFGEKSFKKNMSNAFEYAISNDNI